MSDKISSRVLGPLVQNKRFDDWWESIEIEVPFFENKRLKVIFMDFEPQFDPTFITEADDALDCFLKLGVPDRNGISHLAYKNCIDFLNAVRFEELDRLLRQLEDENDIWKFIYPTEIYISRRLYNDKDIYIQIACECEWEQEHGLQLVFRQGKKLTRISDQDGHLTEADAYNKPDEEDELLSMF